MKKLLSLTLALASLCLHAQQDFILNHDTLALSWSDFQGKVPTATTEHTHAEFYLGYRPALQKTGDSTIYRLAAVGYFDKGLSYADSAYRTENRLRYHQVQFDLLELHRRQLQKELDVARRKANFDDLFRNIYAAYSTLKGAFEREFQQGKEAIVLLKWEQKVDSLLLVLPSYVKPASVYYPFNFGVHLGASYSFIDQGIQGQLTSGLESLMGLQVGYAKLFFQLNNRPILFSSRAEDNPLGFSSIPYAQVYNDFMLGYRFFERPYISIAPLAGVSIVRDYELYGENNNRHKPVIGLNVDVVLLRELYNHVSAFKQIRTYYLSSIKTQFLLTHYDFLDGSSGLLFTCGVGIYLGQGFIK
jgi:hypothetical protein